jgi:hypothetical protein
MTTGDFLESGEPMALGGDVENRAQAIIEYQNPYIARTRIVGVAALFFHRWNTEAVAAKAASAIALRQERVQWVLRRRDERGAERRRAVVERLHQEHRRRVRFFDEAVRTWRRQRTQLAFLRALKRAGEERVTEPAFAEWLAWAERHVRTAGMAELASQISAGAGGQESYT